MSAAFVGNGTVGPVRFEWKMMYTSLNGAFGRGAGGTQATEILVGSRLVTVRFRGGFGTTPRAVMSVSDVLKT